MKPKEPSFFPENVSNQIWPRPHAVYHQETQGKSHRDQGSHPNSLQVTSLSVGFVCKTGMTASISLSVAKEKSRRHLPQLQLLCWAHTAVVVVNAKSAKVLARKLSKGHTTSLIHSTPHWTLRKAVLGEEAPGPSAQYRLCLPARRCVRRDRCLLCKWRLAFRHLATCQCRPLGRQNVDTFVLWVICSF